MVENPAINKVIIRLIRDNPQIQTEPGILFLGTKFYYHYDPEEKPHVQIIFLKNPCWTAKVIHTFTQFENRWQAVFVGDQSKFYSWLTVANHYKHHVDFTIDVPELLRLGEFNV